MSENLEIKIDLKLDDSKAQTQMSESLKTLRDLAGNKANNIDIKFNVDKSGLADLKKVESAIKEINKLSKETQKSLFSDNSGKSATSNAVNAIKDQQKLYDERRKQEVMYSQMFNQLEKQKIKEQERMYKDLFDVAIKQEQSITEAKKQQRKDQMEVYKSMFKDLESQEKEMTNLKLKEAKEQERINKAIAKQEADQLAKSKKERAKIFDSIGKDMQKALVKTGTLEKSGFVDQNELNRVKNSLKEISDIRVWDNIDNLDLSLLREETDKVLNKLRQIDEIRLDNLKDAKVENFTSKMVNDLDKLENKFKELGKSTEEIDKLRAELQTLDSVAPDRLPTTFQRMRQEVSQLNGELKQTSDETSKMGGFLGDISDSMRTFTLGNLIGDGVVSSIRAITTSFTEMDAAITNVKKVAEATDVNSAMKLDNIKSQAIDIAKEVGMATTDVINGIADSLQAGMGSMEQSIAVARSSLMLANVGDMAQADASAAVNTMVKGFNINPLKEVTKEMNGTVVKTNELTEAMDMLNHAGNNYAIGTDGVAEALKRGGSVLSEYGVSLGDTVALITSANEAVQNPEKVGNGMKSIAINLAGVKASAKEGKVELNKTASALKDIAGIDVYSNKKTGEIKNMVQILDEVEGKWESLRDDERLALSEAIAGKQQAMIFQSLMGNFDTFKKMRDEFANNDHLGSAEAENAQYVDSIAGKLNSLKETWVSISQTMVSSDFTKGILDGAIKVSEAIDKIIKGLDEVNALTPTLVAVGATFGKMMKTMVGNSKNGKSLFSLPKKSGGLLSALYIDISNILYATEDMSRGFQYTKEEAKKSFKNIASGALSATKFLASFIGQGLLIAGVTALVSALAKKWDEMAHGLENAEKKIKTNIDDLNNSLTSSKGDLKFLEETETRYNDLITKKKEYSSIPVENLSEEQLADMQELKDITSELAEMFPELVIGYDSEGSPIMLMADDMNKLKERTKEQIELQQKLLKEERRKLADNSRKQIQEGNKLPGSKGIAEKLAEEEAAYKGHYNKIQQYSSNFLFSVARQDIRGRKTDLKELERAEKNAQESYNRRLQLYQDYTQKELEIQQSAFDRIQEFKGYGDLKDEQASSVNSFLDNLNWAGLNEGQSNSWINASKKIIDLAKEGSPKIEEWNKKLQKANDVYSANGDVKEYEKSLKGVAKAISEDLNIPYETVFAGLENMTEPLNDVDQKMQDFLKTFGKTRYDLLNGDSVAEGLAEQFLGVQEIIERLQTDEVFKAKGTITFNMAMEIANKDSLPDEVQRIAKELSSDGVTEKESKIIIDILAVLNKGKSETTTKELNAINKDLESIGEKSNLTIDTLFNVKGLEKVKETEEKLNKIRHANATTGVEIIVDGQDKADLYLQIIREIEAEPELTNKFIIENEDALSKMKSFEEVKAWLQKNPDIVAKYQIKGFEEAESKAKKVNEVIKDAEGEKEVNLKVNDKQVIDSIDSIETLIKYSAEIKDGKYKLSIEANTSNAVSQLKALKRVLEDVSKVLSETPTKTYNIATEQASKNVTGLRNNVSKLQGLMSKSTTMVFKSETAQASKNVTGLINNIKRCMALKPKTIVFKSETAQASKNISGLIRKINSVPTGTKTITYKVVTKYETSGTPTSYSKGKGPKSIVRPPSVDDSQNSGVEPIPVARDIQPINTEVVTDIPTPRARATDSTPIAIAGGDIHSSMKYTINLLQELENRIASVTNQLSVLDKKMKHATGDEKIKYLKQQNTLYAEQLQLQKDLEKKLIRQKNYYEHFLKSKGFQFTSDGNLKNYEEKLILMEKELEKLEKIADSKSKASSDYKGDNEKQRDKLSKNADKAKESADKYKENLDEVKKYLSEYIDVATSELPKVQEQFIDINNSIKDNINSIKEFEKELSDLKTDTGYKNNNRDIWEVENKLSQNQIKLDNATGQNYIEYLEERIRLTQELTQEQKDLLDFENQKRNTLMGELGQYGFKFRDDGSIESYGSKIEELKKSLSEEEFTEVFAKIEEYLNTTYETIPDLSDKILELGYSVEEYKNQLKTLERERVLEPHLNKIKELENEYDRLADKLSIIDIKLKDAYGKDKLALMEEQIALLEEQQEKQASLAKEYEAMAKVYQKELTKYKVEFDKEGNITNLDEVLNANRDSKDIEELKKLVDEYIELQRDKLPDAVAEWEKLNSAIKDAYKEQLNITKNIEDEITEIYKKQVEERKNLIDEELKKRLDAINKEKEAYNKSREEAKYQENYDDQMDKVKNLEKQLEIAKKDTSLSGQKKVQDLLDQLKEEQKKLQDMVQDELDNQVNDMFDQESDRLQEEADKTKEDLDKEFSDKKIQELVKEALNTGVFEDIDGTMRSLQDVMLEFVDEYGEGLGATGSLIKNELIANLEIAKNTMKDMVEISKGLGLIKYSYDSDILNNASKSVPQGRTVSNQSPVINFNESLINIEGNVDRNIVDELKNISQDIENNVINSIVRELR